MLYEIIKSDETRAQKYIVLVFEMEDGNKLVKNVATGKQ